MNSAMVIGRLVANPEIKQVGTDKSVANFSVAVNNGKDQPATFIDCSAWNGLTKVVGFLGKGDTAIFKGRTKIRKYTDKNGNARQASELVLETIELLGRGNSMRGKNQFTFKGRLTADPKSFGKTTKFSLAVNDPRNKEAAPLFIDVVTFNGGRSGDLASVAASKLTKGSMVLVEGRLQKRSYDRQNGGKGEAIELLANSLDIVYSSKNATAAGYGAASTTSLQDEIDDEIPF